MILEIRELGSCTSRNTPSMLVMATIVSALRAPAIFAATVSALILYVLPSAPIPMEEMTGI